ncbi:helix-turn-helix domain-containing protein [Luteimonas sp. 22616]|uniref:helix-turn-helix domain-containing protein n=1 Tax=Luteimonas sp. 22616 TaxID=3453951 RepID=UPI003F858F45
MDTNVLALSSLPAAYPSAIQRHRRRTLHVLEPLAPYTPPQNASCARRRISENLRRLRKAKGLSQEQLAESAGFHRTYESQIERCVTNVSIDGLERLAQALGVDIVELLRPPA